MTCKQSLPRAFPRARTVENAWTTSFLALTETMMRSSSAGSAANTLTGLLPNMKHTLTITGEILTVLLIFALGALLLAF
jgi:hypothetical protein